MNKKEQLLEAFNEMEINPFTVIQEAFLGYKYRKREKKLYDGDAKLPTTLIKLYYELNPSKVHFDNMKKRFITEYINNESKLEDVDYNSIHGKKEIEGLREMYNYIHSDEIEEDGFEIFSLCLLHKKLYSKADHPEYAGKIRNFPAFLPGTGTETCDYSYIFDELLKLDDEVKDLINEAKQIREEVDADKLLDYLDKCVVLQCKLVKIHPFGDGNGRTIRGFINKLLEDANIPPIYIKVNERSEYHKAMNKANNENDYTDIKHFYRYKVCDSIIELDINERIRKQNNQNSKRR